MSRLRVVAVVGLQDAGKTTLAVRMVAYWRLQGLSVAAIKHDGHAGEYVDWEKANSDTALLGAAGAGLTMVAGGGHSLIHLHSGVDTESLDVLVEQALHVSATGWGPSCDVILAEGFKTSRAAKVAVIRDEQGLAWLKQANLEQIVAVVGPASLRDEVSPHWPMYDPDETDRLCADLQGDEQTLWLTGPTCKS
jgi:molybdopterin-guanine dinucleotide biosynthesis adapter protein